MFVSSFYSIALRCFVWRLLSVAKATLMSWTILNDEFETTFPQYRMQGAYSAESDCVYITSNSDEYCFNLSSESIIPIAMISSILTFNGAYQNTVLFRESDSNNYTNDILYYMHGNNQHIIKQDTGAKTMVSLSGSSMSTIIDTNPCMVSHSTNREYLFIVGNSDSRTEILIAYSIVNDNYTVVNELNENHQRCMCTVVDDYLYAFGGESVYIERISLDNVLDLLIDLDNFDDNNNNIEWETVNAQLPSEYSDITSATTVNYDRLIYVIGGRTDHENAVSKIVYFNVDTLDVGYNNVSLPYKLADSLAVYVFIYVIPFDICESTCGESQSCYIRKNACDTCLTYTKINWPA